MYNNQNTDNRVYLIYCDIGNYRHWVKESTSVDKFFDNYDKLCCALDELTTIEYEYHDPSPDEELKDLQDNVQVYIRDFLTRAYVKAISDSAKLKTDKGKINKIKAFFDSLEPYKERFSDETIELINKARAEQPNYSLKYPSKSEKDELFLVQTEKQLETQNEIMNNIDNSQGIYAWFYKNHSLLISLISEPIDIEIIYDITRLLLSDYDPKKGSRYLHLKYNLGRKFAEKIYLTSLRILWSRRDFIKMQSQYQCDPKSHSKYIIYTHSVPCEKCQEFRGRIFDIKNARFGVNFPPFCSHGCSTAHVYSEGVTKIPERLRLDEILFAKAFNLFDAEQYEEAADYGLQAYNLVPESSRYAEYVSEMLIKAGRTTEAVKVLKQHVDNYTANSRLNEILQKYKRILDRENKHKNT